MQVTVHLLFALALFLFPAGAHAQDAQWTAQVRELLNRSGAFYEARGYVATEVRETGTLRDDESESVRVPLDAGVAYAIFAVCDIDCTDIDLVLYDPAGQEVDKDVETDDVPIMMLTLSGGGRYRLKVTMADCTESPCFYGLAIYRKNSSSSKVSRPNGTVVSVK